jgi:hypothetical protein
MNKLYYTYSERYETIHDDYGKDGPYTGRREDRLDWTLNCLFINQDIARKTPYYDSVDFAGSLKKDLYCVIVRYTTGGTFGQTSGKGTVAAVTETKEEAKKIKASIEGNTWIGYCPWDGYFEHLETVEIERREVEDFND